MTTLALLQLYEAAEARLTPDQLAQVNRLVDSGEGVIALFASNDGHTVHVELAVVPRGTQPFQQALLRLDGPVAAAAAPPGAVRVIDRGEMN
jgi:hypothetical protein